MHILINTINSTTIEAFLLNIPESVGLLAFGVGLTATAVIIRRFLGRAGVENTKQGKSEIN